VVRFFNSGLVTAVMMGWQMYVTSFCDQTLRSWFLSLCQCIWNLHVIFHAMC